MALSISDQANGLSYRLLFETDSQSSTPVVNATGTSGSLYSIHADITFPGGWPYTTLSFWVGTAATETNSADPGSAVKLALVTS